VTKFVTNRCAGNARGFRIYSNLRGTRRSIHGRGWAAGIRAGSGTRAGERCGATTGPKTPRVTFGRIGPSYAPAPVNS